MACEFPLNEIGSVGRFVLPRGRWLAAVARKDPRKDFVFGPPPVDFDEDDDECLLETIGEWERFERSQAGILGRWPFWEIKEWATLNPKAAERVFGCGVLAAGVAAGLAWPFVWPWLMWLGRTAWWWWEFLAALFAAVRGVGG